MLVLAILRGGQRPLLRSQQQQSLRLFRLVAPCQRSFPKTLHNALSNLSATRAASTTTKRRERLAYPESLVIYHAGTGRSTFLACLKLTTLFVFAFFGLVVTPAYLTADEPLWKAAGVATCGIVPLAFVAYTTSPFVAWIHLRLPPHARLSRDALAAFLRSPPPATRLDVTTMNIIGKPRRSQMTLADLRPARRRLGMVNYVRDTGAEDASRPWYMFRAVGNFKIEPVAGGERNNAWVWREVAAAIARRNAASSK
ncbi:hypothetical protein NKR23_g11056 [Pleurostoma richardsiae]|uniref:Uncharacterized protein n=1 Tax=Pleurostoma richardsiae TaxID=41990 RepID=A0AA38RIG7_9PEZI|nr:hypothetical protein NKR23_g11056 [Pleurostoma richardsiae]